MSIKDLLEKGKKARQQEARKKAAKSTAIGAAIGTAIGSTIGLLFAPKSGKETREQISQTTKEAAAKAKEGLEEAKEKMEQVGKDVQKMMSQCKHAEIELPSSEAVEETAEEKTE